jgi:DNA-binding NarL/FixJ family response regulator
MKIKILLVDDHDVVRKGIKTLLETESGIDIVGEAKDGMEAINKVETLLPNIIIMDLTMPNISGIEATKIITDKYVDVKVIIFSMHNNSDYIIKSVENGAFGYLMKESGKEEILKAIYSVADGKKYFPTDISNVIIDDLLVKNKKRISYNIEASSNIFNKITHKEKEILEYIIQGKSSREIADNLKLSIRTIDNHRANMMKKTKAKNTADLVKMAVS